MKKLKVENLTRVNFFEIKKNTIILTEETWKWCKRPYKNHRRCMNWGKPLCPPNSFYFGDLIDLYEFFYIVYADFNIKKYIENRSKLNPERSINQIKSCIYWQHSVKKLLKDKIKKISNMNYHKRFYILGCGSGFKIEGIQDEIYSMESVGINVFSTMRLNGVKLEIHPKRSIKLVCLLCSKRKLREGRIEETPLQQQELQSYI